MHLSLFVILLCGVAGVVNAAQAGVLSHFPFPSNLEVEDECDYQTQACAPLSDLWSFHTEEPQQQVKDVALVGVLNGISFIDVTNRSQPEALGHIQGCLTEWRDIKVWGDTVYVVNDKTALCSCFEQPCQDTVLVQTDGVSKTIASHEGSFSKPLEITGNITAEIAISSPLDGCENITTDFTGKLALIQRGNCMFAHKVVNAMKRGAVGVVIVNDRQDIVPPSMTGEDHESQEIVIPSVMVSKGDGEEIMNNVLAGKQVTVSLLNGSRVDNQLYRKPDGLVIVDMKNPSTPTLVNKTREFFTFAHNIFIESERPLLYACGVSCLPDDLECVNGLETGGIMVFNISQPHEPQLVGSWDDAYIHDVVVYKDVDGRYVLFGAAIYDGCVFRLDVTEPEHMGDTVVYFQTMQAAHNSWVSSDLNFLFVTHEDDAMPITVFDISDPLHVEYITQMSVNIHNKTIPHNVIVQGNLLWASYYSEGVVVWDVTDPTTPQELARVDTSAYFNGYHGVWGIFPLPDNSGALASDIEAGLFVIQLTGWEDNNQPHNGDDDDDSDDNGNEEGTRESSRVLSNRLRVIVGVVGLFMIAAAVLVKFGIRQRRKRQQIFPASVNRSNVSPDAEDEPVLQMTTVRSVE